MAVPIGSMMVNVDSTDSKTTIPAVPLKRSYKEGAMPMRAPNRVTTRVSGFGVIIGIPLVPII